MMRAICMVALVSTGCGNLFGLVDVPPASDAAVIADATVTGDANGPADASLDRRDAAVADAIAPPSACPAGYGLVGGQRIKVHTTPATWTTAQQTCLNERGNATSFTHLVVIADDIERSAIGAHAGTMTFWLGLTDRVQDTRWAWVTNETATYPGLNEAWAIDEPSTNVGYDCALQRGNDDFLANDCGVALGFICECDAYPNDPANY